LYFNRISILSEILESRKAAGGGSLKQKGRKRPADAELLLKQVASAFSKKKEELGSVKRAAKELQVCISSFYKYMAGENVPDMDVLRRATIKWGIKWKYLDPSEIVRSLKMRSAEQLVFSFLNAMEEEDVEIVEVTPNGKSTLQIVLQIRIPSHNSVRY
jgi:hypothetical protein